MNQPWERLHLDFGGPFENNWWLIVVDAFSQYPFVTKMASATSTSTINALTNIFSIERLLAYIVTDNGAQFT